jgi:hypothetical protein
MDILTALQVYKELADWYERQGQSAMRDRFLVLAAEAAFSSGNPEEAERLRQRLLQGNPHHMLKPFSSFAQALQSTNIQVYIHDLQANYPPQTAETLLQDLRSGGAPAPPVANEEETLMGIGPPRINPIIEIRDEPTLPLGPTNEPLKVYSLRDEPKPATPPGAPAKPAQTNRPAPPPSPSPAGKTKNKGVPPGNPPTRPRTQPILPRAAAPAAIAPPPPETALAGAWLPLILFGMTVTAGIALAVYTLARPFLPIP